jgi:competence protein ComEC
LVEVLKRYQVSQVLYPALDYDSAIYSEWLSLVREKGIKYTLAEAGQQIDLDGRAVVKLLNPQKPHLTGTVSDLDNNGVELYITMVNVSFLLTADIMWEAEFELIAKRVGLTSIVLNVAHHGLDTSTTPEFLAVANPQIAVISLGADNPFGHPSPAVMERLQQKLGAESIYRTDERGTIEFITDGDRLWVRMGNGSNN